MANNKSYKDQLADNGHPVMPDVDFIMRFEAGECEEEEVIEQFQLMINSGVVWTLQGSYGRCAHDLIDAGHCMVPRSDEQ